jgi:hypothetical protein
MTYVPSPLKTHGVTLPEPLLHLLEEVAKHVHDTWAQRRIDEGWTYGPERNDAAKTHPSLVPYEELSEEEKEYDRQTALETLRAVATLDFEIVPPADRLLS